MVDDQWAVSCSLQSESMIAFVVTAPGTEGGKSEATHLVDISQETSACPPLCVTNPVAKRSPRMAIIQPAPKLLARGRL